MWSASLRLRGPRDQDRTGCWGSLHSWPTTVDVIGPNTVQALTHHSHRLPGWEGEAPRHHTGPFRQLRLQLVLQQWKLWERARGCSEQGGTWLLLPSSSRPNINAGVAWASPGASKPQTYHTGGQEHRYIVAVLQAHLWEEEVTSEGNGTPAREEVWWA